MLPHARLIAMAVRATMDGADHFTAAFAGAHGAATSPWNSKPAPTDAQCQAGNYAMGTVMCHGLRLAIENPAHTVREGTDPGGATWRNVMQAHYGYFAGTRGADGDGVDVFLGPMPESTAVWVLNQTDQSGAFDEHKVLMGFADRRAAVDAYRLSYTPGWDRYGPPVALSIEQLRWWLKYADKSRALTLDLVPPEPDTMNNDTAASSLTRVMWDSDAMPACGLTLADVLYAIRLDDARDGLALDPVTMADITEGAELVVMDALVTEAGRLRPKMDALLRIMELAGGDLKPLSLQITEPMRRFGGVHVAVLYELSDGQTVTVWFHNPDSSPAKLTPADSLVSWKWQLNKKDITIVVAPESGKDLNLREVSRRIMRLAAKNSAAFAKANAKRAEVMAEIQGLKDTLVVKQEELAGLQGQIEVAKVAQESRVADAAKVDYKTVAEAGFDIGRLVGLSNGSFLPDDSDALNALIAGYADRGLDVKSWARDGFNDGWDSGNAEFKRNEEAEARSKAENLDALERANKIRDLWKAGDKAGSWAMFQTFPLNARYTEAKFVEEMVAMYGDTAPGDGYLTEAEALASPEGTFTEWEDKITTLVELRMQADRSDAQGIVEAQPFYMQQQWSLGAKAADAYEAIWGPNGKANKPTPAKASEADPGAQVASGIRSYVLPGGLSTAQAYALFLVNGLKAAFRRKHAKAQGGMSEDEFDAAVTELKRMGALTTNGGLSPTGESLVAKIKSGVYPDTDPKQVMSDRVLSQFYGLFGEPTVSNYGVKPIVRFVGAGNSEDDSAGPPASGVSDLWRKINANEYRITALDGAEWVVARVGKKWLTEAGQSFADLAAAQAAVEDSIAARARTAAEEAASRATATLPSQWLVTNTKGYRAVHEAETMVRAIQAGMAEVDYTLPSAEWNAELKWTDPAPPIEVYAFAQATDEAKALFAIGATDPSLSSAYRTAVSIEKEAAGQGMSVSWDVTDTLPAVQEAAMDAVGTFDIVRNAGALGLKWSLKNLTLHDGDENGWFKLFDSKAEAIQFLREAIVVYRDESPAAAKEWLKKNRMGWKPGAKLDSADGDADDEGEDFDPDAEFRAAPSEEDQTTVLDGDFKGHPFRGNQHAKGSRESSAAVGASIRAKRAESKGDRKAAKSAHRGAHYAHMAAAETATGKARKYHRTMAKFHGTQSGVMDSVSYGKNFDHEEHRAQCLMVAKAFAKVRNNLDDKAAYAEYESVVKLATLLSAKAVGKIEAEVTRANGKFRPIDVYVFDGVEDGDAAPILLLDAVGLFGDVSGGYIKGTLTRNGVVVAEVFLRGDGLVMFKVDAMVRANNRSYDPTVDDMVDNLENGWRDNWFDGLVDLASITEGIQTPEAAADEQAAKFAAEDKARAEQEAAMAASEAARSAALADAQAFGKGKPGFVAAIADRGGDAIKSYLARKPVGSFLLVVAPLTGATWGVGMYSRQNLTKSGRGIDPDGKVGNVQVSGLKATAAEAYEAGAASLTKAGGVVLGGEQEPASKAFTVRGVDFEAVRFMSPIPHWRLKIVESGEVWQPGTGGVKGESVPKLIASVEDLAGRSKTDAEWRFNLGLPKKDAPAPTPASRGVQGASDMYAIKDFMPVGQRKAIASGMKGEEADYFIDKMAEMRALIEGMPETYQQSDKGDQAIVYLHYFRGGADWYITEKDKEGGVDQAFGLADLFQDGGELGYISIRELTQSGVELDLHWTQKTLAQVKLKAAPKDDPASMHRYALVNRPAGLGTIPKGPYEVEPRPAAGQPHHDMARHGILVVPRELTEAEIKAFELAPLVEGPDLDVLAARVADGMSKYAAQYVEAVDDDPTMFRNSVLDLAARPKSGIRYSIASPDALVDRVEMLLRAMVPAKPEPAPPVADQARAAAMAMLELVAAGTHPQMLEPELIDQIEAAVTTYGDDAELQALAERAFTTVSTGLLAATPGA